MATMTAREWIATADQFWLSSHKFDPPEEFVAPFVVCRSFATEAYLKCLLLLRGKQYPNDHDLMRLFKILPHDDRVEIEASWNQSSRPTVLRAAQTAPAHLNMPTTLTQALKRSRNAFKEWRYKTGDITYWYLGFFAIDVRAKIVELRPDWSDPVPAYEPHPQLGKGK